MLYPRLIPCLLVQNNGLTKTIGFKKGKYIGDPLNAVKIFNEKEVDEMIVLDIDATRLGKEPNYTLIERLAMECRMPLCYGGGIKNEDQAKRIFNLGVEKIAISSLALESPEMITKIAEKVGNQSVVVVLDVKRKRFGGYEIMLQNGTVSTKLDPINFAKRAQELGAGEIVINSIDRDGTMEGPDKQLIAQIREAITIPLTVMGGISSLKDMGEIIEEHGVLGIGAGSLFVFKGRLRAVLINYPTNSEKVDFFNKYFRSH